MNRYEKDPESCKLVAYAAAVTAEMDRRMKELWLEGWKLFESSEEGQAMIRMNALMLAVDQDARDIACRANWTIEEFDRERLIAKVWD